MTLQHRPADDPELTDHHGPGTPGTLRPGERGSVLVLTAGESPEEAMADAVAWITAFEHDCGLVLDTDRTSLYAVAETDTLTLGPDAPADEGVAQFLDFVLADGAWHRRGTCPPAPDDGGPSPWARHVHRLQRGSAPGSVGTVWDVYPLPAAH